MDDKNSKKKKRVWINKKILQKRWEWQSRSMPNLKVEEEEDFEEDFDLRSSIELSNTPINFILHKPAMEKQKSETNLTELLTLIEKNIHIVPSGSKDSLKVGTPDSLVSQLQNHSRSEFKFINKTTEKIPTSQTERERIYPTATHPSNAKKNRYPNVLANEKTMVTLRDSNLDLMNMEKKELELSHNFPGLFPSSPRGVPTSPRGFGSDPISVKKLKKKSGFYKKGSSLNEPLDSLTHKKTEDKPLRKSSNSHVPHIQIHTLHNSNNSNNHGGKSVLHPETASPQKTEEYINANFIQIPHCDRKFISCQAPLPSTMLDFWRMVWQQNTSVIVCLTDLYEGGKLKAHRYWPDEDEEELNYKYYTITLKKTIDMGGYEIRVLNLKKMNQEREVYHFFYTEWPDFGVPTSTTTLISLIKISGLYRLKGIANKIDGPTIVHCSAGLGRTGTYVGLSFSLEQLKRGRYPIVHKIIASMRDQRHGMVQTEEQYFFVFEALNDYINERLGRKSLKDF